jgi:hypothetical protein
LSAEFKKCIYEDNSSKIKAIHESIYFIVNTLYKINEPMNNVFTEHYIKKLNILNNKLFR